MLVYIFWDFFSLSHFCILSGGKYALVHLVLVGGSIPRGEIGRKDVFFQKASRFYHAKVRISIATLLK